MRRAESTLSISRQGRVRYDSSEPLWGLSLEQALADIWPKLRERIPSHATEKARQSPLDRMARSRFTIRSPGIGKEVIAGNRRITRVRWHGPALTIAGKKGHLYDPADTILKRLPFRAEITWIFAPKSAEASLHCVAHGDSRETHAIAFAEAVPMRPIFFGRVE